MVFLLPLFFFIVSAARCASITGTVAYTNFTPAAGAVVYALDPYHKLNVSNNTIMVSEHIPRAITDAAGKFQLDNIPSLDLALFIRDIEDQCLLVTDIVADKPVEIVLYPSAKLTGRFLKGKEPVKKQKITATFSSEKRFFRYTQTAMTNNKGIFEFDSLMPGSYLVQVIEEAPQVGCSFRSVVTQQANIQLSPGWRQEIQFGGTDLPYLTGKVSDSNGEPLHGVWVRLEPNAIAVTDIVFSDVTAKDGSYAIFDIPQGDYTLICFRRLALNNAGRTLQAEKTITIHDNPSPDEPNSPTKNICNVTIELEPFMPLEYDKPAPPLNAELLSGQTFSLADYKGKIVVLHFYANWCMPCNNSIGPFKQLAEKSGRDKVAVIGISLDSSLADCWQFIAKHNLTHPQIYAGPWQESKIRKAFRVVNVPSSFVIDPNGNIAQIDLFGHVLQDFVQSLSN